MSGLAQAQAPLIGVNSTAVLVRPGTRDTVATITVDPSPAGGDLFAVMLTVEGVGIQVELPDGRRITKENASAAGFEWDVAPQGEGDALLFPGLQGKENQILILPPHALKGKYRVHADARGVKEGAALMVEFLPLGSSADDDNGGQDTVKVAVMTPEGFHYAGDPIEIVAGVFEGQRGVSDARFTAVAVQVDENGLPKGNPMRLNFRPSGPGAEGSYTANLPTTAVGKYEVGIKVEGKYKDGTKFERNAATNVEIELRRAKILSIREQPVDDDGNGLIDRIEVTAHVKVEVAGQYLLNVDLRGAKDKYMQGSGKAQLGVGDGEITAVVNRFSLTHVGVDGPYEISARLFRKEGDGEAFASVLDDHTQTRPYKLSSFDRGALYIENTVTAAPESASGQPPFDKLKVTFDVFSPGGACRWFGGLYSDKTDIEWLNNNATLPKGRGQITLTFDGYKISNAADGKPLQVNNVRLNCGNAQAPLEQPASLQPFPGGTFAKSAPGFELDTGLVFLERGTGSSKHFRIDTQGGFNGSVDVSIEGLPEGLTVEELPRTAIIRRPEEWIEYGLRASPSLPVGKYPVTVHVKHGSIEREASFTIVVK